jgi:hypothetical protein
MTEVRAPLTASIKCNSLIMSEPKLFLCICPDNQTIGSSLIFTFRMTSHPCHSLTLLQQVSNCILKTDENRTGSLALNDFFPMGD